MDIQQEMKKVYSHLKWYIQFHIMYSYNDSDAHLKCNNKIMNAIIDLRFYQFLPWAYIKLAIYIAGP